jgi:hypothetical protein
MGLHIWDHAFVRARRRDVHPVLLDVAGYGRWWPGVSCRPLPDDRIELTIRSSAGLRRRRRLVVKVTKDRPELGVRFVCDGDVQGEGEWFYLDEPNGVIVHAILRGTASARRRTAPRDLRWAFRDAFFALQDRLEQRRQPGDEPDPALLEDQKKAIRAFQARQAR